jgi:hypothetical protein
MSRIARIVPTIVLTATALALAAPVAQARPYIAPSGGTAYVSPSVQSTQGFNTYGTQRVHRDGGLSAGWRVHRALESVAITTGDTPLANPVQLPSVPVNAPNSGNGFDWTAAALGAGLTSILLLMLAAGAGVRRRGQLAA